jgi:hypothetical protein
MRIPRPWLQFADLFDCLDNVLAWAKDRDGRYGWVNRAFLISYSLDGNREGGVAELSDVIGKTDYDFSPAFLADQFRLDDEYVLAGNRIIDRIEMVGRQDAEAVWNVTNKVPLIDERGAVIGTAGITRRLATSGQALALGHEFGTSLAQSLPTCATATTLQSPTGNWPAWPACRCGRLSGNSTRASI